jgi:hypothetical protein
VAKQTEDLPGLDGQREAPQRLHVLLALYEGVVLIPEMLSEGTCGLV